MRDRYVVKAAKAQYRGTPKKGMVRIASFRFRSDADRFWTRATNIDYRNWYLLYIDLKKKEILNYHQDPECNTTGELVLKED